MIILITLALISLMSVILHSIEANDMISKRKNYLILILPDTVLVTVCYIALIGQPIPLIVDIVIKRFIHPVIHKKVRISSAKRALKNLIKEGIETGQLNGEDLSGIKTALNKAGEHETRDEVDTISKEYR